MPFGSSSFSHYRATSNMQNQDPAVKTHACTSNQHVLFVGLSTRPTRERTHGAKEKSETNKALASMGDLHVSSCRTCVQYTQQDITILTRNTSAHRARSSSKTANSWNPDHHDDRSTRTPTAACRCCRLRCTPCHQPNQKKRGRRCARRPHRRQDMPGRLSARQPPDLPPPA